MATVLIVDADTGMAELLVRFLTQEGHYALTAHDDSEALRLLRKVRVDLIIAEYPLPPTSSGELSRWLRADPLLASIPVLLLLPTIKPETLPKDVLTGQDASLAKPVHLPELKQTVWRLLGQVHEPTAVPAPHTLTVGCITVVPQRFEVTIDGQDLCLSPTEFHLLLFLAQHAGEVLSTGDLLEAVWHYPPHGGSPELVRVHIRNLRRKIGLYHPHPERIIRNLRGLGYLLSTDD